MASNIKLDGKSILKAVLNLIRYDIPCLLLGKSSIGKSYSLLTMAKKFRLNHNVLFVGSEKAEHIEGLPKLMTTGMGGASQRLEYFRPWWFPDSDAITNAVKNGKERFEALMTEKLGDTAEDIYNYDKLNDIFTAFYDAKLSATTAIIKEYDDRGEVVEDYGSISNDDHKNICVYLSTLLGYGNFWLILDEIDKVEEMDIEKYAPLLHIVRERTLKDWNLREANNGKGIDIPKLVKNSNYKSVADLIQSELDQGKPLLDTRVMAVANATDEIEEALFRRFVQVIVEDVLIWDSTALSAEQNDMRDCVTSNIMGTEMMSEGLMYQKIDEVNLQWQFNFLIKMLNRNDSLGNYFVSDYLEKIGSIKASIGSPVYIQEFESKKKTTVLYKILEWSYDEDAKTQIMQRDADGVMRPQETDTTVIDALFQCCADMMPSTQAKKKDRLDPNEEARLVIEEQVNKYGDDWDTISDNITNVLKMSAPKIIGEATMTEEGREGGALHTNVTDWGKKCLAFVDVSMTDQGGSFSQSELNRFLTPKIYKIVIEYMSQNKEINWDTVKSIFESSDKMWEKAWDNGLGGIMLQGQSSVSFDAETTQIAMFGLPVDQIDPDNQNIIDTLIDVSKSSLIGASSFIKDPRLKTEIYKNSISYDFMMRQIRAILPAINAKLYAINQGGGNVPDEIIEFLGNNFSDEIRSEIATKISHATPALRVYGEWLEAQYEEYI